jgi:hypothetical protein
LDGIACAGAAVGPVPWSKTQDISKRTIKGRSSFFMAYFLY